MRFRQRLFAFLAGRRISLRGRYSLYGAVLTTLVVVVLNTYSYLGARGFALAQLEQELAGLALTIAKPVEQSLQVASREVAILGRQSLLANALIDSPGRDGYLRPFLARHQLPVPIDYNLVLTDHRGNPLAARQSAQSYRDAPWFGRLLQQDKLLSTVEMRGEQAILYVATPILYASTGTNEGALVLETNLTAWLSGTRTPFLRTRPLARIEFLSGDKLVSRWTASDPARTRAITLPLDTPWLGLASPLVLRLVIDEEQFEQPLNDLLFQHLLLGVLAIVLVAAASVAVARVQTRRIEALAREARSIVETGKSSTSLNADGLWNDEISDLAAGLARLLGDVRASQEGLEALVARRTADVQAREADLKRAQAIAQTGSWVFDAKGDPPWSASEETRRIFGFGDQVVLGRESFAQRVHGDDRKTVERAWQGAMAGASYDLEYRILREPQVLWVREQLQLAVDADGRLVSGIGTVQDVTARRQADELLRELSTAVEQSPASIVITGIDGSIRYVNPQFERATGYRAAEVIGKNPRFLKSGRTLPFEYASLWATLRAGKVWRGEFGNRRKDGSLFFELASISPIFSADGSISGYVAVNEDITAQKEADRVLQEARERYSLVVEGAELGTWDWNIVSGELSFNEFWARMLGYRVDQVEGHIRSWQALVCPDDLGRIRVELGRHLRGEIPAYEAELRMRHRLGHWIWVLTRGRVIERDAEGNPLRAAGTQLDITERKRAEEALRESERNLREAQEVGHVGSFVFEVATETWKCSAMIDRIFGIDADYPHTTAGFAQTLHPAARDEMAAFAPTAAAARRRFEKEFRIVRVDDGAERWVLAVGKVECAADGTPLRMVGTVQDITERRMAEAQMREAMAVFRASSQAIMTTDTSGVIISVNPAFSKITGYRADEVLGQRPAMFKSGRHDENFYQAMWETLLSTGIWEGEIWNRRKNNEIYPEWLTISAVRDLHGRVTKYVSLFSDITQRKQQEEVVWRQANFDPLTGLANRSLLHDRLERALAHGRRSEKKVGLLFIDLDGFKWINDALGHAVGDQLLIEVAHRLQACVRGQDTVARLGGDEFTIVVDDLTDAEDLKTIGDKVVNVLRAPFALAGGQQYVSGSVGITVFPDDGEDVQTLLKNADIAMYKSKQSGKNRFQFYARHMHADALARMQIEADLRDAIETQAFVLHYQPVVDADTGELVGAEALIRWLHPKRGLVSPQEFIPVAEDCGLIVTIGEWALREAARQWRAWRDAGRAPLRLSVNVSSMQFRESGLPELLERLLGDYRVDHGALVLEITESVLMDTSAAAEGRMRQIKGLGVGFSLDDFGTGFSSLSYLKRFPVDIVKIDRSFVHDCPDDRNDARLVEAIINMAHSLDLRVTAEGVETAAQMNFLRDLGCDYLQGHFVSHPVPAAEFERLFERPLLLLRSAEESLENIRLLAALRYDTLDVEHWLRRLFGEQSAATVDSLVAEDWVRAELNLKQTVQDHLAWRHRLSDHLGGRQSGPPLQAEEAAAIKHCSLGEWIASRKALRDASGRRREDPHLRQLDRAHREFHQLAEKIVSDFNAGYQESAQRTLSGLKFRTASRDIVVALVEWFRRDEEKAEV
jgi:diguanylate cyclase (GGDEF)-like protein/PAS domain S-box-containing protein